MPVSYSALALALASVINHNSKYLSKL